MNERQIRRVVLVRTIVQAMEIPRNQETITLMTLMINTMIASDSFVLQGGV